MSDLEQTKVCPLCAEKINPAAKVCPHCRHWQKNWSLQNPQVMAGIWVVLCLIVLVCLGAFVEKIFGDKRDFAEYKDQIEVVNSHFSQRKWGSNFMVTVVGTVTNRSDCSWQHVGLEAQFFDSEGKLIDVVVQTGDYGGFAILRNSDQAFKIEGRAAKPETNYAGHKVRVRWAKDSDAWP
jgi:hypothetical protein